MERHLAEVRALLEEHGVLPVHDAELPSLTRAVAGTAVKGSWWGHPKGKLIFRVLSALEDEVVTAKLIRGKVTLIHARLVPALVAVGRSGEPWQRSGLRDDARTLLSQVEAQGTLRTDQAELPRGARKIGPVADDLERRLLVASAQLHTESGRHARALTTWSRFLRAHHLRARDLPTVPDAKGALAAHFPASVFPW